MRTIFHMYTGLKKALDRMKINRPGETFQGRRWKITLVSRIVGHDVITETFYIVDRKNKEEYHLDRTRWSNSDRWRYSDLRVSSPKEFPTHYTAEKYDDFLWIIDIWKNGRKHRVDRILAENAVEAAVKFKHTRNWPETAEPGEYIHAIYRDFGGLQ